MRFPIIVDPHFSDRPPGYRVEGYAQQIAKKIDGIASMCSTFVDPPIDCVICVGDIFHNKAPSRNSHELVQLVQRTFAQFAVPIYIVPGNHDLSAGRLDSLYRQPLGDLAEVHNVNIIGGPRSLVCGGGVDVMPGISEFMGDSVRENVKAFEQCHNLLIAHIPIAPPGKNYPYPFVPAEDLAGRWNLVLYGHQHCDDGHYRIGRTLFINYGSLSRGSVTYDELHREVRYAILDCNKDFTEVKAASFKADALPAEQVFHVADAVENKESRQSAAKFMETLGTTQLAYLTKEGMIERIRTMALDPLVIKCSVEVLEKL